MFSKNVSMLSIPLRGSETSQIPLMTFLGHCPRIVSKFNLDLGIKCTTTPVRLVVAITKDANEVVSRNLAPGNDTDVLLRFQPTAGTYENGLWVGPVVPKDTYLEVQLPIANQVDLCEADVYVVSDVKEGEKEGTLRVSINCAKK